MQDKHGQGPREPRSEGREGERRGNDGPPGTDFLDLEISQVLYGEASGLAREAARELLKDAVKARLRERLGSKLDAIAKIAADELADDIETNLAVEALISARKQARRGREEALRHVFQKDEPEGEPR